MNNDTFLFTPNPFFLNLFFYAVATGEKGSSVALLSVFSLLTASSQYSDNSWPSINLKWQTHWNLYYAKKKLVWFLLTSFPGEPVMVLWACLVRLKLTMVNSALHLNWVSPSFTRKKQRAGCRAQSTESFIVLIFSGIRQHQHRDRSWCIDIAISLQGACILFYGCKHIARFSHYIEGVQCNLGTM